MVCPAVVAARARVIPACNGSPHTRTRKHAAAMSAKSAPDVFGSREAVKAKWQKEGVGVLAREIV